MKTRRFRIQLFRPGSKVLAISFASKKPGIKQGDCYVKAIKAETDQEQYAKNNSLSPKAQFMDLVSIDEAKNLLSAAALGPDVIRCLGLELQDVKESRYIDFSEPFLLKKKD